MKQKDNKTEVITLRVTPELKAKLQLVANKDQRTVSNYIQIILEKAVSTTSKK